jgi:hypothetical protein
MDDGFLFADSEGEFFELFEEFLKCIVYNNLKNKRLEIEDILGRNELFG